MEISLEALNSRKRCPNAQKIPQSHPRVMPIVISDYKTEKLDRLKNILGEVILNSNPSGVTMYRWYQTNSSKELARVSYTRGKKEDEPDSSKETTT